MMEKTEREEVKMERGLEVPIERHIPDGLPVLWSNHFIIQHTEEEFMLTFFQVAAPILLEPTEEEIEAIKSVRAIAVARIVLTPQKAHDVLEAMQKNVSKFEARRGEIDVAGITE